MPEQTSGLPKTKGRRVKYDARDVAAVLGGRSSMRIRGKQIGEMSPAELADNALSTHSPRHRMACVAELLGRIAGHDVRGMLRRLDQIQKESAGERHAQPVQ